ncbi:HCLS1-associated protein X-1-like isoform X2 [Diadema setosum]|uniref:HCLS1-associated protein X-1-like isoform X2 n=1 Tax=Diadema setosum TaxID=31175 RepID=UPI003B3A15F6
MNFSDAFRSFFGIPEHTDEDEDERGTFQGPHFFTFPPGGFGGFSGPKFPNGDNEDDGMDFPEEGPPGRNRPFPGGFHFAFDREMEEMFKHFDEMFRNFGLADFPSHFNGIAQHPPTQPGPSSLRDQMLKEPDRELREDATSSSQSPAPQRAADRVPRLSWFDELKKGNLSKIVPLDPDVETSSTAAKKDSDLDSAVKQRDVERAARGEQTQGNVPQFRSYSRSVSIQTIRRADGTTETRRTEIDDKGNETTTVTTTQGEMPHPGIPSSFPRLRLGRPPGHLESEEHADSMFEKFFGSWFRK